MVPNRINGKSRDARLYLLDPLGRLMPRKGAIPVIHRFELAAIHRDHGAAEQAHAAALHHELSTHRSDRSTVVAPEVAMVLKSGASRPVNHISAISRPTSLSSWRLN